MALTGLKVIEFAGLAPGPFAGLVLADNGASVTRIDRPSSTSNDVLSRGKRSIVVDSKSPSGRKLLQEMISTADVLIDPFRPGVLERLGLGPEVFLGDERSEGLNKKLVYARVVGFPRTGAQKDMAGHDLNYMASSGVLSMFPGTKDKPSWPLNLVADFAGGGLLCATGILLALFERARTGRGQVVNTDMVSGARYVSSFPLIQNYIGSELLGGPRGENLLDGGAPFYNLYTCQDGGWMSVGCLEPQFFKVFINLFVKSLPPGFNPCDGWTPDASTQLNKDEWPNLETYLTEGFLTKSRDTWGNIFHETDACAVPVLTPAEAGQVHSFVPKFHPSVSKDAPTFSDSKQVILKPGTHTEEILRDFGYSSEKVQKLAAEGALGKKGRSKL